jgi:serine/threonine protein kinase
MNHVESLSPLAAGLEALSPSAACLDDATVSALLLGALEPRELPPIDEHLHTCEICFALVAELASADAFSDIESGPGPSQGTHDAGPDADPSLTQPRRWKGGTVASIAPAAASRFRHLQLIGRGGMADVYRAIDGESGRVVAVKRPRRIDGRRRSPARRLVREGAMLARFRHPNIIAWLATLSDAEGPLLVMEHASLGSLRDRLHGGCRCPWPEVLRVLQGLSEALAHVHESRVLHRDIKPENVLMAEDGGVRLADFGLAEDLVRLSPGKWVGTVGYLSPEALRGEHIDARTDLWALGVIAFEMLAGARPFDAGGYEATAQAILRRPVPSLPRDVSAPRPVAELVQRMLAHDRHERIASARELSEQLAAFSTEPSLSRRPRGLWVEPTADSVRLEGH